MDTDLDSLYTEARSALKAKDYDHASDLLRQILIQDENYKDTSRLLAQTIKLRRRRWYSHPLLWGGLALVVVVGIGFFIAPRMRGLYPDPSPAIKAPTNSPAANPLPAIPVTATETSLPAPTPVPWTWKRISLGADFARDTVAALVIDPNDSEVLYTGMKNAGIYKSIDGGLSWRPAHYGLASAQVLSLLIDSKTGDVLFAGTREGIYKTDNGGENWSRIGAGSFLLIDPQDSSHLYARDGDSIYESTDQGKNWKAVYSMEKRCPDIVHAWAIHPTDGKILFVAGGESCEPGLYLSRDGGNTWSLEDKGGFCEAGLSVGLDKQGNYFFVNACEHEYTYFLPLLSSDSVYSYWESDAHLYKESKDEGPRLVLGKPEVGFVTVLAIPRDDPDTIYAAGEGVSVSRDSGLTWTKLNNGLGSGNLQLDASTGDSSLLYLQSGGCNDFYAPETGWDKRQSLYISTDSGTTWDFAGDTGCSLVKDTDGSTLYRLGVKDVPGGESYGWIWRSRDAGRFWEKVITPERVLSLAADTTRSGLVNIYVVKQGDKSRQQYVSEDYGHSWKEKEPPTELKLCYGAVLQFIDAYRPMAIDLFDRNHVFVIDNGALLESHDSCETTKAFETSPNTNINSIAFDHNNPGTLYAGTDQGAYISLDSGETWVQISDGLLGATVVYSITVDKESNVYAATPYGIFKLEEN